MEEALFVLIVCYVFVAALAGTLMVLRRREGTRRNLFFLMMCGQASMRVFFFSLAFIPTSPSSRDLFDDTPGMIFYSTCTVLLYIMSWPDIPTPQGLHRSRLTLRVIIIHNLIFYFIWFCLLSLVFTLQDSPTSSADASSSSASSETNAPKAITETALNITFSLLFLSLIFAFAYLGSFKVFHWWQHPFSIPPTHSSPCDISTTTPHSRAIVLTILLVIVCSALLLRIVLLTFVNALLVPKHFNIASTAHAAGEDSEADEDEWPEIYMSLYYVLGEWIPDLLLMAIYLVLPQSKKSHSQYDSEREEYEAISDLDNPSPPSSVSSADDSSRRNSNSSFSSGNGFQESKTPIVGTAVSAFWQIVQNQKEKKKLRSAREQNRKDFERQKRGEEWLRGFGISPLDSRQVSMIPRSQLLLGNTIGRGNFGVVQHAKWRGLDVAVKKLFIPLECQEKEGIKAFIDEIKMIARLRHPNIVQFLGATPPPDLWLVTEYMPLGSLDKVLQTRGHKEVDKLEVRLRMARDISLGMSYLHGCRILHRDLSPNNILVDENLVVKLADFGLSLRKIANAPKGGGHNGAAGTPAYMSPEVLKNEPHTASADVYSFGVCLWQIVTRKEPYSAIQNPWQIVYAVTHGERPDTIEEKEKEGAEVPDRVQKLISRCWASDPAERPRFEEIAAELERILSEMREEAL